jgi:ketosteroid isomerase-like protein
MKNLNYFLLLFVSVCIAFIACNAGNKHEAEEATIRKAYEALSKKDFAAFAGLCSEDYTELSLSPSPIKGVQNAIKQYKVFFDAIPDFKAEISDIAAAGKNKFFIKVHLTGTNTASFMNLPATSKHFDLWNMDIVELNDAGKAISHWIANPNAVLSAIGYGSVTNPSTGLVMAAYEAFGKKDIQGILNLCNDDIVFEIHDAILNPNEIKTYKGKQEVAKFFEELGSKITYTKFQPTRFLADGDDVAIFVSTEFKQNSSGKNYNANYCHHFKTSNGKISYFKGVLDTPKMSEK